MVLLYNVLAALINVIVVVAFKMLSIKGIVTPASAGLVRNLFGFFAFLPLILFQFTKNRDSLFKHVPHKLNIWLGVVSAFAMILWPMVFINIETHIAMTFAFLLPFFANLMLKIFCKEEIPMLAWIAKVLCLIAVMIILRPQLSHWGIYHNLGLICVILWAMGTVFQKKIGMSIAPAHITLYWYIFLATIGTVLFSIHTINSVDWSFSWHFLALGLLNSIGNLMTFLAFKYGKGYFVQMMEFVKFIMIIFIDITMFGVAITAYTVFGSVIIVFAILLLIIREYRRI